MTSEAQPGQEQRMVKPTDRIVYERGFGPGDGDSHVERVEQAARPTADLGDDGDLVALLGDGEWWQTVVRGPNPTSFSADLTHVARQAADRIESLLALVKELKNKA